MMPGLKKYHELIAIYLKFQAKIQRARKTEVTFEQITANQRRRNFSPCR